MDMAALIKAVLAPDQVQRPGDLLQALRPGDKITGRVIKLEDDGRVLMDLGRTRALAQIGFEVAPGQVLRLEVVENGPVLHLRVESPQSAPPQTPLPITDFASLLTRPQQELFSRLAESLTIQSDRSPQEAAVPKMVQNAILRVNTLFESVSLDEPVDEIGRWIKEGVEDRGPLFEKRLADWAGQAELEAPAETADRSAPGRAEVIMARDIKAQLLILKNFLAGIDDPQLAALKLDPKAAGSLLQGVERLLWHVEMQQERAVARHESGSGQQVLVHLFTLADQQRPLQLKVYYPEKRRAAGGDTPCRIALMLEMDRLGAVRADLALFAGQLHLHFFVGSDAVKTEFLKEMQGLETALAPSFQSLRVDISVSQEKISRFHLEDLDRPSTGRIDINA
jgi:hypothetical protein